MDAPLAAAAKPIDGLRALIIEDNALILENLQATLLETSAVRIVGTARSQAEACAWMDERDNGCDVAIIDIFLNSGDGLGVLRHMARYQRPPERIVLTNYATAEMRSRCRALGADAVFDKSTEIDALIDWLNAKSTRH